MAPTLEEFQAWADSPLTQWVFRGVANAAALQKAEWDRISWEQGQADPLLLCELRTRADAYEGLRETTYERWCELNGEDPRTD